MSSWMAWRADAYVRDPQQWPKVGKTCGRLEIGGRRLTLFGLQLVFLGTTYSALAVTTEGNGVPALGVGGGRLHGDGDCDR